jgi:hypothetical protein
MSAQNRLNTLKAKHGDQWRTKRAKTPRIYPNGHSNPLQYCYIDQQTFEALDFTHVYKILTHAPLGYYINDFGETYIPAVINLTHDRYAAAYYSDGIEAATIDVSRIYADKLTAAYAADSITERAAERERDYYELEAQRQQREENRAEYHRINRQLLRLIRDIKENPPTETQLTAQRVYITRELKTRSELLQ